MAPHLALNKIGLRYALSPLMVGRERRVISPATLSWNASAATGAAVASPHLVEYG
jgi:hypothetical protein